MGGRGSGSGLGGVTTPNPAAANKLATFKKTDNIVEKVSKSLSKGADYGGGAFDSITSNTAAYEFSKGTTKQQVLNEIENAARKEGFITERYRGRNNSVFINGTRSTAMEVKISDTSDYSSNNSTFYEISIYPVY